MTKSEWKRKSVPQHVFKVYARTTLSSPVKNYNNHFPNIFANLQTNEIFPPLSNEVTTVKRRSHLTTDIHTPTNKSKGKMENLLCVHPFG